MLTEVISSALTLNVVPISNTPTNITVITFFNIFTEIPPYSLRYIKYSKIPVSQQSINQKTDFFCRKRTFFTNNSFSLPVKKNPRDIPQCHDVGFKT